MAERRWAKTLAMAALLLIVGAGSVGFTQSAHGSLSDKLTDLDSKPLSGAAVVVRNQATGMEVRSTTTKGGGYRFTELEPGEYMLEAEIPGAWRGQVDGIVVAAGHESRVQTALKLEPLAFAAAATEAKGGAATAPKFSGASAAEKPNALAGPFLPATDRTTFQTVSSQINASVQAENLQTLPLTGRAIENPLLLIPKAVSAAKAATTPLQTQPNEQATETNGPQGAQSARATEEFGAASGGAGAPISRIPSDMRSHVSGLAAEEIAANAARATLESPEPASGAGEMPGSASAQGGSAVLNPAPTTDTVTAAQLQAQPITGRNWQNFVLDTQAGDVQTDVEGHGLQGSRSDSVAVDSSSIRLAFGGSGVGRMSGRGASLIGPGASETAIREVQTATGNLDTSANYAGGRTNVETMRGSTGLHGQGSLFNRQNLWGAQNPFTQWVKETAPASLSVVPVFTPEPYTPSDRETTWGFGLGGQIRRRRLFWFAALDSYQRNDPGVSMVKHPDNFFAQASNDQMQVLSARLGLSSTNPVAAGVAAYSSLLETLDGLLGPATRTASQWTGFGRLDWATTERHRFTLEGTDAHSNAPGGGMTRASETFGTHSYGSSRADEQWLLGRWEAFATPNLLAVTLGSFGHHVMKAPAERPSAYEQTLNINDWGQLPQIVVDSRYGFTIGNPARFGPGSYPDEHLYKAAQQLDWVRGAVMVKTGFDLSHNIDATSLLRNQTGTYYYSSVESFASDALAFADFGLNGQLNPMDQHNCDQTGKVWRDSAGTLHGLGYLPCYSYYSQTMGPTDWWLSTNDWAGYVTAQWQPAKRLALSLAMRLEREQLPPPISRLNNPDLPLTEKLPSLGNQWGPRASLAWGSGESRLPLLRLGYGMYFGRTANATLENALTQTGSLKGDLNFFMRPTDNLNGGGAPPFPYVLAGDPASVVKPGAAEFAPDFRNGEVNQGMVSVEESLRGHVRLEASAEASLARRLPITLDANIDPLVNPKTITYAVVDGNNSGPIKARQITVPFFASWPSSTGMTGRMNSDYQQVSEIFDRANSTYEAAMLRFTRYGRGGLSLNARYTYAHAMDWNPDESAQITGPSVADPTNLGAEYGTSDLDVRHSASASAIWEPRWKLHDWVGYVSNGWMMSAVGSFHSGLPFTMRTAGSLAKEFDASGAAIVALAPGMNGYGGDNRVYGVGRNTFRYPATWKADLRLGKRFNLGKMRQLELLAESFNLFNHQNVTELETVGYSIEPGSVNGSLPTLNFLTGLKTGQTEFGQPLNINATNFYRQRQMQFGMRIRF